MGKQAKLRKERLAQRAQETWERIEPGLSSPRSVYLESFRNQDQTAVFIWEAWRKRYNPHDPGFLVYEVNNPLASEGNVLMWLPTGDYKKIARKYGGPSDWDYHPSDYVVDPNELEKRLIPPPTIVVWHEGHIDGDFVSEWVGFRLLSPKNMRQILKKHGEIQLV